MRRGLLLLTTTLSLALIAQAGASERPRPRSRPGRRRGGRELVLPEGTLVDKDIVCAKIGEREIKLDLYRPPKASGSSPLIIWVHGGGWRSGSKDLPYYVAPLLEHGYAVASVEYRLSKEAVFPAAIEDCRAAVSYLRLNAKRLKLNPGRIGAWGRSAGGHLVALMGTTSGTDHFKTHPVTKEASSDVQAVCDWFGPTDFLRMNDVKGSIDHDAANSPESKFIGGPIQENKEKVAAANPITYVTKDDPPFLIMHGDRDREVICNQSELLHDALKKAGVESTLYKVERGGHGFGGAKESKTDLFDQVRLFFDEHLKPGESKKG